MSQLEEKIAKLPAWARSYIEDLERREHDWLPPRHGDGVVSTPLDPGNPEDLRTSKALRFAAAVLEALDNEPHTVHVGVWRASELLAKADRQDREAAEKVREDADHMEATEAENVNVGLARNLRFSRLRAAEAERAPASSPPEPEEFVTTQNPVIGAKPGEAFVARDGSTWVWRPAGAPAPDKNWARIGLRGRMSRRTRREAEAAGLVKLVAETEALIEALEVYAAIEAVMDGAVSEVNLGDRVRIVPFAASTPPDPDNPERKAAALDSESADAQARLERNPQTIAMVQAAEKALASGEAIDVPVPGMNWQCGESSDAGLTADPAPSAQDPEQLPVFDPERVEHLRWVMLALNTIAAPDTLAEAIAQVQECISTEAFRVDRERAESERAADDRQRAEDELTYVEGSVYFRGEHRAVALRAIVNAIRDERSRR